MPLLRWRDDYSVHLEQLDEHHKQFIGMVNRLYDSVMTTTAMGSVQPIIGELVSYSSYHFSAEEQFMREHAHPGLDEHVAQHRYFSEKIAELQQMQRDDQLGLARELIVFLGDWLLHHILEKDKRYAV
ncbi:MAG TPA: bacteriohemerythrin [Desulfuromonadaceae bacterium]